MTKFHQEHSLDDNLQYTLDFPRCNLLYCQIVMLPQSPSRGPAQSSFANTSGGVKAQLGFSSFGCREKAEHFSIMPDMSVHSTMARCRISVCHPFMKSPW